MNLADVTEALRVCLDGIDQRTQVVPHPPRQIVVSPTVFFGPRSGSRETQGGGEFANFRVYVAVSATDDSCWPLLASFVDGGRSIIDRIDAYTTDGVSFAVDGEWSELSIEVGGSEFAAVVFEVEARWD